MEKRMLVFCLRILTIVFSITETLFAGNQETELVESAISAADISIRSLQASDWENYRDLRLTALRNHPKAYGIAYEDEASRSDEAWKTYCQEAEYGNGKWYVVAVTREGNFVGMLGAHEQFGTHMRHLVEIVQAYVDPDYRRQKLMEKLFDALKLQLQSVGHIEQMIAWVTLHETEVAKGMFEKFGFAYAGKLSNIVKFEDMFYDCCWLEMPLKKSE